MEKAPFLPIRDLVIFPNVVTPIYVGRANSIATLEKAIANKTKLVLGLQKDASEENPTFDGDIYEVGVIANIVQIIRMPNNNIKVLVEAESRVKIKDIVGTGPESPTTQGKPRCIYLSLWFETLYHLNDALGNRSWVLSQ